MSPTARAGRLPKLIIDHMVGRHTTSTSKGDYNSNEIGTFGLRRHRLVADPSSAASAPSLFPRRSVHQEAVCVGPRTEKATQISINRGERQRMGQTGAEQAC